MAPMYYRGAAAAIVVYDITKKDSFAGAKSWVKELQRRGDPNVVIALAGNKADMESKRKVQAEEAAQYALESDILYMETSAKTALNVRQLFVEIGMYFRLFKYRNRFSLCSVYHVPQYVLHHPFDY